MRVETLLNPGLLSNGVRVRTEAAKAISSVEITAGRTPGGKTRTAGTLAAFFTDCASKLSALIDITVAAFSGVTSATATAATTIKVVFPETMDETVTPAAAAFAISGDTVTSVAWGTAGDLHKLILTGTGFAAAESLAYTKPATNFLRDRAGNAMASGSKVLV